MANWPANEHRSLMTKHSLEDWTGVQPKITGGNRLSRHKHHNPDSGQPEVSRSIQRHRIRTTTFWHKH